MTTEKLTYNVRNGEAAKLVGCSQRALTAAVRSGELPSALIGAQRLVTRDALNQWLEDRTQAPTPERKRALRSLAKGAALSRSKRGAK